MPTELATSSSRDVTQRAVSPWIHSFNRVTPSNGTGILCASLRLAFEATAQAALHSDSSLRSRFLPQERMEALAVIADSFLRERSDSCTVVPSHTRVPVCRSTAPPYRSFRFRRGPEVGVRRLRAEEGRLCRAAASRPRAEPVRCGAG